MEDVVAQNKRATIRADEVFSDDESFGKTVRFILNCIRQRDAELVTIAEKSTKGCGVFWRGDDKDLANAGTHESRQGVIDQWLVIDREELFTDTNGDGP